jgi:hypothetical protein
MVWTTKLAPLLQQANCVCPGDVQKLLQGTKFKAVKASLEGCNDRPAHMHYQHEIVENPADSDMAKYIEGRPALAVEDVVPSWFVPSERLPQQAWETTPMTIYKVTKDQARTIDWQQEGRVVVGGAMHASGGKP